MNAKKIVLICCFLFVQLSVNAAALSDSVVVFNEGFRGSNTADLLKRMDQYVLQRSPDVVVLMVGTNDMFNPHNHLSIQAYRRNYQKLIRIIKPHAKLILMTIPPVYEPYIIKRKPMFHFRSGDPALKIEAANAVVRRLARKHDCALIDLNSILRGCGGPDTLRCGLFQSKANFGIPDGVHPTYNGARVIATAVYEAVSLLYPEAKRIVCFGDSITFGYRLKGGGTTRGQTYPAILNNMLNL